MIEPYKEILNENLVQGLKVHVDGWNPNTVFMFGQTVGKTALIYTTRGKQYRVDRTRLRHTRLNEK